MFYNTIKSLNKSFLYCNETHENPFYTTIKKKEDIDNDFEIMKYVSHHMLL